jgi:hypothetical protein
MAVMVATHAKRSMTRAAYHEAGHGVVALSCGIPVRHISVQPLWPAAAGCMVTAIRFGGIEAEALLLSLLAGGAAERRQCPDLHAGSAWDADDLQVARVVLVAEVFEVGNKIVTPDSPLVATALEAWHARAARLVDQHWRWIRRVAGALEQQLRVSGAEIVALREADQ